MKINNKYNIIKVGRLKNMTELEKAMQQMCTPGLWEATINFCYQNSNKKKYIFMMEKVKHTT